MGSPQCAPSDRDLRPYAGRGGAGEDERGRRGVLHRYADRRVQGDLVR